jgi:hypothetical protein
MSNDLLHTNMNAKTGESRSRKYPVSHLVRVMALASLLVSQAGYSSGWDAYGGGPSGGQYSDLDQVN